MRGIVLESWKQNPQLDLSVSSEINKMKTYFVPYKVSGLTRDSCIIVSSERNICMLTADTR